MNKLNARRKPAGLWINSEGDVVKDKAYGSVHVESQPKSTRDAIKRVWDMQDKCYNKFRLQGQVFRNNAIKFHYGIEFIGFVDDTIFWDALIAKADELGAKIYTLDTSKHVDSKGTKFKDDPHLKGRKPVRGQFPSDDGYYFTTGPDHGRMERQVELRWSFPSTITFPELRKRTTELFKALRPMFKTNGVSIC